MFSNVAACKGSNEFCFFFHLKIYCGYSLESPQGGDSIEYPQDIQSAHVTSNSKGLTETL